MPRHKPYEEDPDAGREHRATLLKQVHAVIRKERRKADGRRKRFFRPDFSSVDAYAASVEPYRQQFIDMLGWPLDLPASEAIPAAREEFVARDPLGRIYRLWVEVMPGLEAYGLLFLPPGRGPHPLVLSQHGGGGTPEYCSSLHRSWNYNDMSRRVWSRGIAVFAPQLMRWADNFGPAHGHTELDAQLKQLGGSIAALELHLLRRCLDHLLARRDVDASRVGMIGLSYGGFHTLHMAAADPRIRVALPSCSFNNRKVYSWPDMTWFNAANTFLDAEVASLVCPRALYIEIGATDSVFAARHARPEAEKVRAAYERLGIAHRFSFKEHELNHEVDKEDDGIDFLCRHLDKT